MKIILFLIVLVMILVHSTVLQAHETRPAYLEIKETSHNRYEVLWRTPLLSGMRLPVALKFPDGVSNVKDPIVLELPDSLVVHRTIRPEGNGLAGQRIEFVGLQATITDVLVRTELLDGTHSTTLVHPSKPWVEIAVSRGPMAIAGAYIQHGMEHILLGLDHLAFCFWIVADCERSLDAFENNYRIYGSS